MRRRLILSLSAAALVIGGHTLLWRWSEARLESGFAAWRTAQRQAGWTIVSGTPARAGWPLAARLDIPRMILADGAPGQPAPLRWAADRVSLTVDFSSPGTLVIGFGGTQTVELAGAPPISLTAGHMDATTPLNAATPTEAAMDVDIGDLRATLPSGTLTVTRLQLHGDASQAFSLSAGDIALPPPEPGGNWPLGAHIASLVIAGSVIGAIPPTPGLYAAAAAWRSAGGRIDLPHVSIGWGPLGITGTAKLRLDAQMQPDATARLRIVGYDAALDALAAAGSLTRPAADAAKAVLGLIARTPDGGGVKLVDAPVTLHAGRLSVGQFPLVRLPELVWPDGK
jgi:hypothetical protein